MLVWWHWVQTASTVSLPAPCGSAAGRPCSWAWAANGTSAKTAAAIKETVEGPDMFNLPTACSEACLRTAAYEKPAAGDILSCRHARESGHPVITTLAASRRECRPDGPAVTGSPACAG